MTQLFNSLCDTRAGPGPPEVPVPDSAPVSSNSDIRGCVCSARSWKKTKKRDKGISGKKREQLLAEKHSLTPDLELDNAERGRKEMKNLQSK